MIAVLMRTAIIEMIRNTESPEDSQTPEKK